ncbi:hypothetical protein GXP76_26045 [Streptomyces sp. NP-1717]|nr:hypothetical protein [Streptomyces sp. NP-1717]
MAFGLLALLVVGFLIMMGSFSKRLRARNNRGVRLSRGRSGAGGSGGGGGGEGASWWSSGDGGGSSSCGGGSSSCGGGGGS